MARTLAGRIPATTIAVANGTVMSYNVDRVGGVVQNLAITKLYLKFGGGCSASDFSVILVGGSVEDDGYGGSQDIGDFIGDVSIFSAGTPRAAVTTILA